MNALGSRNVDETVECPLCMEPLEVDDLNFYPCTCGYQICRFCWHRIRTDENQLCPACRKEYPENPADFKPLSQEEMIAFKFQKRQRDQQRKQKLTENRKHLANFRVVQKNLVFVVGLPPRLADADVLKKHEYFGKYGKIHKVVINPSTAYAGVQGPSASAYVTYVQNTDALRAIQSVNNIMIDGRLIKTSLGTTKYCSHFMKNQQCPKADCMYLHELGDPEASFTKEEMHQGKHQDYEKRLHDQLGASGFTGTNGETGVVTANGKQEDGKSSGSTSDATHKSSSPVNISAQQKEAWPCLSLSPVSQKETPPTTGHKGKKERNKQDKNKNEKISKSKSKSNINSNNTNSNSNSNGNSNSNSNHSNSNNHNSSSSNNHTTPAAPSSKEVETRTANIIVNSDKDKNSESDCVTEKPRSEKVKDKPAKTKSTTEKTEPVRHTTTKEQNIVKHITIVESDIADDSKSESNSCEETKSETKCLSNSGSTESLNAVEESVPQSESNTLIPPQTEVPVEEQDEEIPVPAAEPTELMPEPAPCQTAPNHVEKEDISALLALARAERLKRLEEMDYDSAANELRAMEDSALIAAMLQPLFGMEDRFGPARNQAISRNMPNLPDLINGIDGFQNLTNPNEMEDAIVAAAIKASRQMDDSMHQHQLHQQMENNNHIKHMEELRRAAAMQDLQKRNMFLNSISASQRLARNGPEFQKYPHYAEQHALLQQQQLNHRPNDMMHPAAFGTNMSKFFDFHKHQQQKMQQHGMHGGLNGIGGGLAENFHMMSLLENKLLNPPLMEHNSQPPPHIQNPKMYGMDPMVSHHQQQQQQQQQQQHSQPPSKPSATQQSQSYQHSNADDDLGFDPFIETQKGLAELIENEDQQSAAQHAAAHAKYAPHSQFNSHPMAMREHMDPMQAYRGSQPGFPYYNNMGPYNMSQRMQENPKLLPYMNESNPHHHQMANNVWGAGMDNMQLYPGISQMRREPPGPTLDSQKGYTGNDWTAMDPAILSYRQYPFPQQNMMGSQMKPQQQHELFLQQLSHQQQQQQQQHPVGFGPPSQAGGNSMANAVLNSHHATQGQVAANVQGMLEYLKNRQCS